MGLRFYLGNSPFFMRGGLVPTRANPKFLPQVNVSLFIYLLIYWRLIIAQSTAQGRYQTSTRLQNTPLHWPHEFLTASATSEEHNYWYIEAGVALSSENDVRLLRGPGPW